MHVLGFQLWYGVDMLLSKSVVVWRLKDVGIAKQIMSRIVFF